LAHQVPEKSKNPQNGFQNMILFYNNSITTLYSLNADEVMCFEHLAEVKMLSKVTNAPEHLWNDCPVLGSSCIIETIQGVDDSVKISLFQQHYIFVFVMLVSQRYPKMRR
jgi:hypothetical protein